MSYNCNEYKNLPCKEKTLIDDACSELLFEESDFIESVSESADR